MTLIVTYYTEEGWRGKRAWENYRDKLVAEGVQLDLRTYAPPPVPDDQNFAMTPFLKPILDFNPQPLQPGQSVWRDTNGFERAKNVGMDLPFESGAQRPPLRFDKERDFERALLEIQNQSKSAALALSFPSRAAAAAELLRQLAQYDPMLDELRAASRRPYSRFNIQYDAEDPASILLPHLGILRHIENMLAYRVSAELAVGKTDEAHGDVELMFFLAGSIQKEPIVISHLVRLQMLCDTLEVIREGLAAHLWSDRQLQDFQATLGGLTVLKDLQTPLNAECAAFGNKIFDLMRARRPNYFAGILGLGNGATAKLLWFFPTGWLYFEQLNYNDWFDQLQAGYDPAAGLVHPQEIETAYNRVQELLNIRGFSLVWHHRLFASLMMPGTLSILQKSAAMQTAVDECAVACALERFHLANGKYPESQYALMPKFIAALPHDVITGEPLKYHLTRDGQFVLYSVGWNGTDDGGAIVMTADGKHIDATQGDWVWPAYPAKAF